MSFTLFFQDVASVVILQAIMKYFRLLSLLHESTTLTTTMISTILLLLFFKQTCCFTHSQVGHRNAVDQVLLSQMEEELITKRQIVQKLEQVRHPLFFDNQSLSLSSSSTLSKMTLAQKWKLLMPDAIAYGLAYRDWIDAFDRYLAKTGYGSTSEEGDSYLRYFSANIVVQKLARDAMTQLAVSRYLTLQSRPTIEDIIDFQIAGSLKVDFKGTPLQGLCRAVPKCIEGESKIKGIEYRRMDGACNNPLIPQAGMTTSYFFREILATVYYDDFVNHPRTMSIDRVTKLPSSRLVSIKVHGPKTDGQGLYNLMFMQIGQFLAHDFTEITVFRPLQVQAVGGGFDCCSPQVLANPNLKHPECFAMQLPKDDPYYAQYGVKCLNFLRAVPVPMFDCAVGIREQMNTATAYIDMHGMYGNDDKRAKELREFVGGRLLVSYINGREYPPEYKVYDECSIPKDSPYKCFKVGDDRGNMHIQLLTVHVMFLRFHNLIARRLHSVNPHWNDERIFQEAKRLNTAIYQHIVYAEYLPLVIGPDYMRQHDLWPRSKGYYHGYSQLIEGASGITASTAAFRIHNIIVGRLGLYQAKGSSSSGIRYVVNKEIQLADTYFEPTLLYNRSVLDGVIEGMMVQPEAKFDRFLTPDVTQKLFHARNKPYGLDLAAVDIQRGRDVGLSGYNSWLQFCGFTKFVDFDDMTREFDAEFANSLKSIFTNIDDVDLWTAGVHETPIEGALVGKTLACIISIHFARLKRADRFWYENPDPSVAFTPGQLQEIRKVLMSRIVCETGDDIKAAQKNGFLLPSRSNPVVSCSDYRALPFINFDLWREYRPFG